MEKFKCSDPICQNQWSENNPICCPQCGATEFIKIGKSGGPKIKWPIIAIIIGVLLVAVLAVWFLTRDAKDIKVSINFDKSACSIDVKLDNVKNNEDFEIQLLRSGTTYESSKGSTQIKFVGLNPGTYYVNVKYIDIKKGSEIPTIIYDDKNGPYMIDIPADTQIEKPVYQITIVKVSQVENKSAKNYAITVNIKPDSLNSACEFSIDGANFHNSNVFIVSPGSYNVEARMKNNKSNKDVISITLKPISDAPPISKAKIQGLLNNVSNGDEASFNQLSNLLSTGSVSVSGAGESIVTLFELMVDCNGGNRYEITNITVNNNQIKSLNVIKSN